MSCAYACTDSVQRRPGQDSAGPTFFDPDLGSRDWEQNWSLTSLVLRDIDDVKNYPHREELDRSLGCFHDLPYLLRNS